MEISQGHIVPQSNLLVFLVRRPRQTFKHEVNCFLGKITTFLRSSLMTPIQMFYAICSPGVKATRHVHGIIISVVQNWNTHSEGNVRVLTGRAVHASEWWRGDGSRFTSFCCSTVCYSAKAPFSLRTFSKTHLHCFCHHSQSQNNHRIGLCTQKPGHFPQVHGSGGHHPCWCRYLLSHHLIWPFPGHRAT